MDGSTISTLEAALTAARRTREYRCGAGFDVPSSAVESFTVAIVTAALNAQKAEEHATSARPVMPVVARALDLGAIRDRLDEAGRLWSAPMWDASDRAVVYRSWQDLAALLAEVGGLRDVGKVVHVLAGGPAEVRRVVDGQVETVALCGTRWVPTVADPDGPVCGVCVRALIAEVDRRGADLAAAEARIEKIRAHSRPVRYVVEWAEGKRDDSGRPVAGPVHNHGPAEGRGLDCPERLVGACIAHRPTLAELQARYLEVRQHTLSTAGLTGLTLLNAEAEYVAGEADELVKAVRGLADCCVSLAPAVLCEDHVAAVRHEIADVVLAATTLAGYLGVTVEACIAEKTEADRGRDWVCDDCGCSGGHEPDEYEDGQP